MKAFLAVFFLFIFNVSKACTLCNSGTAEQIRASVFGPDLSYNLFITILPFIILSGIVYLIYQGGISKNKLKNQSKKS